MRALILAPPVTAPEATDGYGCQSAARSARPRPIRHSRESRWRRKALEAIRSALPEPTAEEELLAGFLEIANERMADAVRKISIREGYDPTDYALVAFGGAGDSTPAPLLKSWVSPPFFGPSDAGLLSARGLREAVMERFAERQLLLPLSELSARLPNTIAELEQQALGRLQAEGLKRTKSQSGAGLSRFATRGRSRQKRSSTWMGSI